MYAKEMRANNSHSRGGGGDAPSSTHQSKSQSQASPKTEDFALNYGNYGDPYSFAPYQLSLLLIDFVFNWGMDCFYEDPLSVLVIFVFQSLAIIINLILYIMASASQAMQKGVKKPVSVHHWLNLLICLLYMSITGWWFVWALRKSWPSVSDQFSFTWPNSGDLEPSTENSTTSTLAPNVTRNSTGNATRPDSNSQINLIKEHYTLWSPGFNALYVTHRTIAIFYYFIYMRSTFLVLNMPRIEKFLERKALFVEKLNEAREWKEDASSHSRRNSVMDYPTSSFTPFKMDFGQYLDHNKLSLKKENGNDKVQPQRKSKGKTKGRQILWADDNKTIDEDGVYEEETSKEVAPARQKRRDDFEQQEDITEERSRPKAAKTRRVKEVPKETPSEEIEQDLDYLYVNKAAVEPRPRKPRRSDNRPRQSRQSGQLKNTGDEEDE